MRKPIKLKDPIYGYIEVNDEQVYEIVDSPLFHRLQDIVQTSYASVYPSSIHNRFVHSIGVFYLGELAIKGIEKNNSSYKNDPNFERCAKVFKLACLLHDIGHSPFSHTGEKYYEKDVAQQPWELLKTEINDTEYPEDWGTKEGAPHEIMSALEAVTEFRDIIGEENISFFSRCIIGLKYSNSSDIRNCFIELLNSKTIDVDKLDYLIRDSYFTGFKTVSIDYERLLSSITIEENELCFTKAGLSTLESVVLAHDMERKWLQNHPVIQYESYLIESIIHSVIKFYSNYDIPLFSLDALTTKGIKSDSFSKEIRLLSDSDILYIAKNYLYEEDAVKEYFNREKRKKALWKTEAEYRMFFEKGLGEDATSIISARVESVQKILDNYMSNAALPLINDDFMTYMEHELDVCKEFIKDPSTALTDELMLIYKTKENNLLQAIEFLKEIKNFTEDKGYKFNFAFISSNQFVSNFTKNRDALREIKILFDNKKKMHLHEVNNLFEQKSPQSAFFYLFVDSSERMNFKVDAFAKKITEYALNKVRE